MLMESGNKKFPQNNKTQSAERFILMISFEWCIESVYFTVYCVDA